MNSTIKNLNCLIYATALLMQGLVRNFFSYVQLIEVVILHRMEEDSLLSQPILLYHAIFTLYTSLLLITAYCTIGICMMYLLGDNLNCGRKIC